MTDNRFGEIKINTDSPVESKGPDSPLVSSSVTGEQSLPQQPDVPTADSGLKKSRRRQQRRPRHTLTWPSRRTIIWLSVVPLCIILYGLGSYFFVPMALEIILVPQISKFIERPVEVGRIIYSPFTFELLVDDVYVGPVSGDNTGKELLTVPKARFQFSLARIVDGKLLCSQAAVDDFSLNVIRQEETHVDLNNIYDFFLSSSSSQNPKYWPSWLSLDELKVSSGIVHVDDRLAKKVFTIEQIQFYIPSVDTRERDSTALPKLSAVIDSSPFELNSVRFQNQSGSWRTGFSFEFKNVIIANFKELLPLPATGLLLSEGEADIKLDIILPEKQHGPEGIVVEGGANLRKIKWHDADELVTLTLPEARIVYHIVPSEKRIRLANVDFQEPELRLPGITDPLDTLAYLHSILKKISNGDEILEVDSLLWNNGRISIPSNKTSGEKTEWNDVTFTMSSFTTAGHRRVYPSQKDAVKYTFRARDISQKPATEFFSEGQLNPETVMKGRLEVVGLDMARYPTLLPKSAFGLQKGISDFSFHYEYGGHPVQEQGNASGQNKIYGGTIKTTGYVLTRNRKKAVAGDMMECRNFHLDMPSRAVMCDQLEIAKSDIHANLVFGEEITQQAASTDNWHILVNDLQVNGSTLHTSMKGIAADQADTILVFHDVNIESRSLQSEKVADNIKASVHIGKKGKLKVSGSYSSQTKQGNMQIDLQDLDLLLLQPYYSSWFKPKVNRGMLSVNGSLKLPERDFTGKIRINDLDAGFGDDARVSWRQAFSDAFTYKSTPMTFEMDNVVVQQPALRPGLTSGDLSINKYIQLKEQALPAFVRIAGIRVVDGSYDLPEPLIYSGYQPQLQNINGTLSSDDGTKQVFSMTGKINGQSNFSLQGVASMSNVLSYGLNVQNFSLTPFDSVLKKNAGFIGNQANAFWNQEMVFENNISTVRTKITIQDAVPDPNSSLAPILSLLIQNDHSFEMELEGQFSDDKTHPFLFQQLINKLRHLEVKAAISPVLVLKTVLPDLDLVPGVIFAPGSAFLEDTVSLPLAGYNELLKMRPFIMMSLQGQYDPVVDGEVLQAALQKEADILREAENKRRALEKIKILQREQKRIKELKAGPPGVITEEILSDELTPDLQPLPKVTVQLDPAKLEDLTRQRTQAVQEYFVKKLQVDPSRIMVDSQVLKGSTGVLIGILPYMPLTSK